MADGNYAAAALIRKVDDIYILRVGTDNTDDFPDATLEDACEEFANPEIDSILGLAYGVPIGDNAPTDTPAFIQSMAAKLTTAFILSGKVAGFITRKPDKAKELEEEVMKKLREAVKGEREIPGLSRSATAKAVLADAQPETRHFHAAYVGPEEDWKQPIETREATDGSGVAEIP